MQHPSCSLCKRIGAQCIYPTKRKSGRRSRQTAPQRQSSLSNNTPPAQEPEQLNTYTWDMLFDAANLAQPSPPRTSQNLDNLNEQLDPPVSHSTPAQPQHSRMDFANLQDGEQQTYSPAFAEMADLEHLSFDSFLADGAFLDFTPASGIGTWQNGNEDSIPLATSNIQTSNNGTSIVGSSNVQSAINRTSNSNESQQPSALLRNESSMTERDSIVPTCQAPLDLSDDVAIELVRVYFSTVQRFLPLLHQPAFEKEFLDPNKQTFRRRGIFDKQTNLLLNAMFALAVRFSNKVLCEQNPKERGLRFAETGRKIHDELIKADQMPCLRFLQGSILLTYHELTLRPTFQTWLSVSTCCRIAYALSLHQTDKKLPPNDNLTSEEWTRHEERRRAWWTIYYMDNFASIVACRPFNIDTNRMDVLLPATDSDWFACSPSTSVSLSGCGLDWQKLLDLNIQNPYAWFLVSNIMLRAAHQEFDKSDCSVQEVKILQASLHCLGLTLPSMFRSLHDSSPVDGCNFTDTNWAICTQILVQSAQILTNIAMESTSAIGGEVAAPMNMSKSIGSNVGGEGQPLRHEKLFDLCAQQINEHLRSVRMWSSDAIPTACPLTVCALIGPAAVFTVKPLPSSNDGGMMRTLRSLEWQILDLVLKRFSEYWEIGQHMRDLLKSLVAPTTDANTPSTAKHPYMAGILPEILQTT